MRWSIWYEGSKSSSSKSASFNCVQEVMITFPAVWHKARSFFLYPSRGWCVHLFPQTRLFVSLAESACLQVLANIADSVNYTLFREFINDFNPHSILSYRSWITQPFSLIYISTVYKEKKGERERGKRWSCTNTMRKVQIKPEVRSPYPEVKTRRKKKK